MIKKRNLNKSKNENLTASWLKNNTLGLFFGFLEISVVGLIYSFVITINPSLKIAGYAVIFAGILQGTILGEWQTKALRVAFPKLNVINWILLTAIASSLIWVSVIALPFIKIFPSISQTATAQATVYSQAAKVFKMSLIYSAVISLFAGLFLGYILSFLQWIELGKHVKTSFSWIFYNSLAWALGFSSIIVLLSKLPYTNIFTLIISALTTFFLSSLIISAVSLIALLNLKKKYV